MKIAILGGGAMGSVFGGCLSVHNQVTIVEVNQELVSVLRDKGICIVEPDGTREVFSPNVVADTAGMGPADLVIVFVKSMYSEDALRKNQSLIDSHTCLMTLQNGSGHEDTLLKFADARHVIIGTTQHNACMESLGVVRHGGKGQTVIGGLSDDCVSLEAVAEVFRQSGLECETSGQVRRMIWKKLFTNVSVSALTGVFQCPLGFIRDNEDAWELCRILVKEAADVANAEGMRFDLKETLDEVEAVCRNSPDGITSICADMKAGRKTEVDSISGSVVRAGEKMGVPTPGHLFLVHFIHAMERR